MLRFAVVLAVASAGCDSSPDREVVDGEPLAGAKILSTGCSSSPHNSIQSAIDAAANGDIVEVCPGTYRERLLVTGKSITLRSRSGAAVTTIDAQWLGRALDVGNGADVAVEGFTFRNGTTTGLGGNVSCMGSTLELRDSVLVAGTAGKGGALGASNCIGIAEGNTIDGNSATGRGGGVYVFGDLFNIERNTIRGNTALNRGGGLYIEGSSAVVGNTFDANHTEMDGGAAFLKYTFGDIVENTVTNNTSLDDGGGIYVLDGGPLVLCNTFDLNVAEGEGGGLRIKIAEAVIEDNVFTSNHADYRGGAMRVSHDEVTMTGNLYVGNSTWGTGGAVLLYESASVVSDEIYEDNEGDNGGALAILAGWGDVLLQDMTFIGNEAENGGHIYIELLGHTTTLLRVDLIDGEAEQGGAVWARNSIIEFENTLFDGNVAEESGGAMWLDTCTGEVVNSVIHQNDAPEGAGITVVNSTGNLLDLVNNAFVENTTGAAIAKTLLGWNPGVRYNNFYGNSWDFSGMIPLIGVFGNISAWPGFVDPVNGDFHLDGNSGMLDAGSPAIADGDGSTSDIGLYGGPNAL